ncbi:HAMP domain-containing methyl-accepting chemotaxis protein [Pseudomonas huanghezhanensis]|uniref:HAMP domain-containing methyl-accepting chemotaxis protein n=1 Tax=Pseudomonas huanghezhanensis TaxID=3002903 RepID=UPI002285C554|nr:methyl-accepting chemotaxis protein [Pseudomonas sp. BSw22131]
MFRRIDQALGDTSVKLKLSLGFGLVLMLTLAIALTGWHGLDTMIERSESITAIGQLNAMTKDLRAERITFRIDNTPQSAQRVVDRLNEIEAHLNTLRADADHAELLKLLNGQSETVRTLEQTFADLGLLLKERAASKLRLNEYSEQAVTAVGQVENKVLKAVSQEQDSSEQFDEFTNILQLRRQIQNARYEVLAYVFSGQESYEVAAITAIDESLKEIEQISQDQAQESASDLKLANQALKRYRDQLALFKEVQVKTEAAHESMEALGETLLASTTELSSLQSARRDSEAGQSRTALAGVAGLALTLGLLAAWLITQQIIAPLRQTLIAAERIAQGDLSQNLAVTRRDEMGEMQQRMQSMTESLRALIGGISDGVSKIASAAGQLSSVTQQTSIGVNKQKDETDQVATAMNEMTATVMEVARNAEEASEAASQADLQAREGDKVVNEAITQIERLADEVTNSTQAMGQLKTESDKIGGVLNVIKSVSQQTNLLALNAAIEAARAGEAGRGFAVVADEVRSLAQRTQQSTEEIEELIAALQNGTQQVVNALDASRMLTDNSVDLSRRAGSALEHITRTVSTIQSMNQQIATAGEEQSAVAEQINRSVLNVRDISDQTAAASDQTASASAELARLGLELQEMVGKFRV